MSDMGSTAVLLADPTGSGVGRITATASGSPDDITTSRSSERGDGTYPFERPAWRTANGGRRPNMSIGPVQLIVLGFDHPNFHGEVKAELQRLRDSDAIRVIDALAVFKDAAGEIEIEHLSNMSRDEAIELGSVVGALVGLGVDGEEGAELGAVAGAEAGSDGMTVFNTDDAWDVIDEIPNDSAAALLLIEHHWAVPLRDAIARAGGFRISDGFISPLDLVAVGALAAEEVNELPERAGA